MSIAFQEEKIHEGKNLKRIREIMGLKQEALGQKCGGKFDQRRISEFENMWTIPEPTLQELADALGVTVEFIRSFNEEKAIYNIQHNHDFHDNSVANHNYQPTFHNRYDNSERLESIILNLTKIVGELAEEVKRLRG